MNLHHLADQHKDLFGVGSVVFEAELLHQLEGKYDQMDCTLHL